MNQWDFMMIAPSNDVLNENPYIKKVSIHQSN
jgi:hypothetical protein